jgi:hypothetical protein
MALQSSLFRALIFQHFFSNLFSKLCRMNESFERNIRAISRGDTSLAESFFRWPGGRRYLENLTLILLHTVVPPTSEKEEMYLGFLEVLDNMEERVERQKEGDTLLSDVFSNAE